MYCAGTQGARCPGLMGKWMEREDTYLIWSGKENERVASERARKRRKCYAAQSTKGRGVAILHLVLQGRASSWGLPACAGLRWQQKRAPVLFPKFQKGTIWNKWRITAIMALQGQLHCSGICKVTWNTCTSKSHLLYTVLSLRHSTSIANVRLDESFTINHVYFGLFSPVWVWGQWRWCYLADLFMLGRRVEEGGVYPWSRWLFQAALEESACLICIQTASLVPISQ